MTHNKTSLYALDVSPLSDGALFSDVCRILSEERRRKVEKLIPQKSKILSAGAELILRYSLADNGIDFCPTAVKYGENGKPYSEEIPVFFNLSHSGDYVICAVSDVEIGCDIEKIKPDGLRIAKRFFTENEYRDIISHPDNEKRIERFYRYWTLKESYVKATGIGMKLPFDSFEIKIDKSGLISSCRIGEERQFSFAEHDIIHGYKSAVCTVGDMGFSEYKLLSVHDVFDFLKSK